MTGTLVNAAAIITGGLIGLCLQKGIQARFKATIMQAISLTVILIGIRSALNALGDIRDQVIETAWLYIE